MKSVVATQFLLLGCVLLLGYLVWMHQAQLEELALDVDKIRGAIPPPKPRPVPKAKPKPKTEATT